MSSDSKKTFEWQKGEVLDEGNSKPLGGVRQSGLQKKIDQQAIIRRESEMTLGIFQPPNDPPSFLSKLFS